MQQFSAGEGRIHALAFSSDGRLLVADLRAIMAKHPWAKFDYAPVRELAWWDWQLGTAQRRFRLRDVLYGPRGALAGDDAHDPSPEEGALDLAFTLNPWRIATAWQWTNKEDGVCVFDGDHREPIDLRTPYETHVMRLALSPHGEQLAVATASGSGGAALLEVWQLGDESVVARAQGLSLREMVHRQREHETQLACPNPFSRLTALAFDGRFVAAAGIRSMDVLLWDCRSRPPTERSAAAAAAGAPVRDVGFVPACLALASGVPLLVVGGAELLVHDIGTTDWRRLDRPAAPVSAAALTANGRSLLAGTSEGQVELWDVPRGSLLQRFKAGRDPVTALAFAPGARAYAAGTFGGQLFVWGANEA
jgi:WD40 repeat protein